MKFYFTSNISNNSNNSKVTADFIQQVLNIKVTDFNHTNETNKYEFETDIIGVGKLLSYSPFWKYEGISSNNSFDDIMSYFVANDGPATVGKSK